MAAPSDINDVVIAVRNATIPLAPGFVVIDQDTPAVDKNDELPRIIASPAKDDMLGEVYAATRIGVVYPIQLTFVGASNRSQDTGRGSIARTKERVRRRFDMKQPFAISYDILPDLYRIDVTGGSPIERRAWLALYDIQLLFVFIELINTPD